MKKKIVVTGMGVLCPIGNSTAEFREALVAGKSGIARITQFDPAGFDSQIAGEVKNFNPSDWMDKRDARKMCRFTQLAVAAARQALDQAGLLAAVETEEGDSAPGIKLRIRSVSEMTGVVLGNGIGGFEVVSESFRKLFESGPKRMLPLTVPMMIGNEA
ncbi:MAG: beta-ketoacyl-[acyl-carrier-protein] synthase II, partial [Treponema sp.]|nr:beta-ketoacyl-[acyl-carrier-protein] synthase II [Treponema sp.]